MSDFMAKDAANPGRAGHRMAVAAEQMLDEVRFKLTRFFDGDDPNRLIFAMNCTDALNIAIKGVVPERMDNGDKPHVITTLLEHNSVSRPLQAMFDAGQIDLTRIGFDAAGFVDPDEIRRAITSNTVLIVMTHASNVLGTIQDAAAIGVIAREHEVYFCLDVAQTAGVVPISIKQLNVDLLAFPGHKSLLGPTGTGGLYIGPRCPEPAESCAATPEAVGSLRMASYIKMRPWREGGTGGDSASPTQPTVYPYYLEGGTPNTVGVVGLGAGLDYVIAHDMAKTLEHEQAVVQMLVDRLADDDRFVIYGEKDATRRVGTLSINLIGFDAPDVGAILDDSFDIAVRPGLHCAPYAHKQIGSFPVGSVRISPGPFNTQAQATELLEALNQVAG